MIRFNVPPYTGRELDNVKKAMESMHICGDGEFTKKCHTFLEQQTGAEKCLLTTSCTHALEMAALLCDIKEGDEVIMPSYLCVNSRCLCTSRGKDCVCRYQTGHHEYR